MKIKKIFIVFAVFFFVSAIYHLAALFFEINSSPLWRNVLFVGINLFVAYFLLRRPRWFIYLFVLLMLQQLYSHGSDLIDLWNAQHKVDWLSLAVLLMLPAIFIFLLLDRLGKLE